MSKRNNFLLSSFMLSTLTFAMEETSTSPDIDQLSFFQNLEPDFFQEAIEEIGQVMLAEDYHTIINPYENTNNNDAQNNSPGSMLFEKTQVTHLQKLRKFKCFELMCNRTFNTHAEVRNHFARKHQNEKRFTCEYIRCDKKYSTRASLLDHVRRIHGPKRFFCIELSCIYHEGFGIQGEYNRHLKRKHSEKK